MIPENRLNTLIDFLHTETFVQDKVQDARQDTDHHHFGNHGRTYAERYRDVADNDPLVPVSTFDNDSTTTSAVTVGAAIPEASHLLPFFSITACSP